MKKIKLFDPISNQNEEKELIEILRSGFWASGTGTGKVSKFEQEFRERAIQEFRDEHLKPPQEKVKDFSDEELRKILGITKTGKNEKNKIREKGLYFKNNTEEAMMNFINHWGGDPYRVLEIRKELNDNMLQEFAVRELLARGYEI